MVNNIRKFSKLFFAFVILISVKGFAQQELADNHYTSIQEEYVSIARQVNDEKSFAIFPASVKKNASLLVNADKDGWATFQVKAKCGKTLIEQQMAVTKGFNKIPIFFVSGIEKGVYTTVLKVEEHVYYSELVKE
ncbi:MAG: hypothetical protein ABI687_07290 [Flavitalea sp.]